jgi:SAM-dependent methyltransferase
LHIQNICWKCAYEDINFTEEIKPNKLKILVYFYYFFRSAFLRGFLATLQLLSSERKYEKKFRIKSSSIKRSTSSEFFHYQGAPYIVLLRIFKEVTKKTAIFDFIDIGCGKGRAVFVAEYSGYNKLMGIELDNELVGEALENMNRYPFKRKDSEINFIHVNALEYDYRDKPTVYFLFNPFNEKVLSEVLDRILASTKSETWFIYVNPMYKKPFEERPFEVEKQFKTRFYTEAIVYRLYA